MEVNTTSEPIQIDEIDSIPILTGNTQNGDEEMMELNSEDTNSDGQHHVNDGIAASIRGKNEFLLLSRSSKHNMLHHKYSLFTETEKKFSPDAFKEAFFWPKNDKKNSKKERGPKMTSVMSSEDWRRHERLKLEEKQQLKAAKDARKAAREAKKLDTAKMVAEKSKLREQKAAAAAKAADAKRKESTKPNAAQKRYRKTITKLNL